MKKTTLNLDFVVELLNNLNNNFSYIESKNIFLNKYLNNSLQR